MESAKVTAIHGNNQNFPFKKNSKKSQKNKTRKGNKKAGFIGQATTPTCPGAIKKTTVDIELNPFPKNLFKTKKSAMIDEIFKIKLKLKIDS